jgi:hypothetical protein
MGPVVSTKPACNAESAAATRLDSQSRWRVPDRAENGERRAGVVTTMQKTGHALRTNRHQNSNLDLFMAALLTLF